MKIQAYKMLSPGTTRGAISDRFYRWTAGQVFNCPADCPEGEFAHLDPANCITVHAEVKAPAVATASIDPEAIETRPVAAKRSRAKK